MKRQFLPPAMGSRVSEKSRSFLCICKHVKHAAIPLHPSQMGSHYGYRRCLALAKPGRSQGGISEEETSLRCQEELSKKGRVASFAHALGGEAPEAIGVAEWWEELVRKGWGHITRDLVNHSRELGSPAVG